MTTLRLGIVTVKVEIEVDRPALGWVLASVFSGTFAIAAGVLAGLFL